MDSVAAITNGSIIGGDFVIERDLARGGMGAVFVAVQRSTGRRRALKILHPSLLTDAHNVERFMQEARIGAAIHSRHVVEVIAAGVDRALGAPWLAMEMLEGQTLAARVQAGGALGASEALTLFAQLGDAIGAAHDAGIVHRDLKPENLFLQSVAGESAAWTLKVLDFGVSKVLAESRTSATSTGQIGTPLWMAPEQCDTHGAIRAATDVWALGLIAFWTLTGQPYWLAAREAETNLPAVLSELLVSEIEPASRRSPRWPAALDPWFARCVHRDAAARFGHARQACDELVALLRGADRSMRAPVATAAAPSVAPAMQPHSALVAQPFAAPATPHLAPSSAGGSRWLWAVVALCFVVGGGAAAMGAHRRSRDESSESVSNTVPRNQVAFPSVARTNQLGASNEAPVAPQTAPSTALAPRPMRSREHFGELDGDCAAATQSQLSLGMRVSGAPATFELDTHDAHVAGCKSVLEVCTASDCPAYEALRRTGFSYWCCAPER